MKHKYLFLLIFLYSTTGQAADGLGRLFLTPDQRAQLEAIRVKRDPRQPVNAEPEAVTTAPAPVPQGPETVTYSGTVRRSDGKSTVWINGKPLDERMRIRGVSDIAVLGMRADGAVSIAVPQASRTASLKVGQRWVIRSDKVEEAYLRPKTLSVPKASFPPPAAQTSAGETTISAKPTGPVTQDPTRTLAPLLPAPSIERPSRERDTTEADIEDGTAPGMPVLHPLKK